MPPRPTSNGGTAGLVRSHTSPGLATAGLNQGDDYKYEALQHPSRPMLRSHASVQSKRGGTQLPHLSIPPTTTLYQTPPSTEQGTSDSNENTPNTSLTPTASLILDTLQLPISTLLQLVPPNLLDQTHERLSSSALQLPVTSVEAILEACRAMNWICATMGQSPLPGGEEAPEKGDKATAPAKRSVSQVVASIEAGEAASPTPETPGGNSRSLGQTMSSATTSTSGVSSPRRALPLAKHTVFDPKEILQRAADVVSGLAASRHVDLVIVSDNKGKQRETVEKTTDDNPTGSVLPISVAQTLGGLTRGDQGALRFALIFVMSRIVEASPVGSIVRISVSQEVVEDVSAATTVDETIRCTFRIEASDPADSKVPHPDHCAAVLAPLGISFDQSTPERNSAVYTIGISLVALPVTDPQVKSASARDVDAPFASEPTTGDLVAFVQNRLERRKAALHAKKRSVIGAQIREWLNQWGCDVARIGIDDTDEDEGDVQPVDEDGWYLADAAVKDGVDPTDGRGEGIPSIASPASQLLTPRMAVAWSHDKPSLVSYPSDRPRPAAETAPATTDSAGLPVAEKDSITSDSQQWSGGLGVGEAVLHPVTGVPVLGSAEDSSPPTADRQAKSRPHASAPPSPHASQSDGPPPQLTPFNFVIIDDDLQTLQRELLRLRSAVPLLQSALDEAQEEDQKSAPGGSENGAADAKAAPPSSPAKKAVRMTLPHRSKSSPQIERILGEGRPATTAKESATKAAALANGATASEAKAVAASEDKTTYAIVYLTSLRNFRLVQDVVQPIIDSALSSGGDDAKAVQLPEILVVPKPLGPRRLLTTLYSVFSEIPLEGSFRPIACASPTMLERSFSTDQLRHRQRSFTAASSTSQSQRQYESTPATSPASRPPVPARLAVTSRSDASGDAGSAIRSGVAIDASDKGSSPRPSSIRLPPPGVEGRSPSFTVLSSTASSGRLSKPSSPAALPVDAIEYFTETASRIGGSGSSGMVIQSPDGRPAGIFFRPQPKSQGSKRSIDNEGGHHHSSSGGKSATGAPGPKRQTSRSSVASGADGREHNGIMRMLFDKSSSSSDEVAESRQSAHPSVPASSTSENSSITAVSSLKSYPAGSIFSPQVDIHSVLSDRSRGPPIATPLPRRGDEEQNEWIHPLPPSSVRAPPSAESQQASRDSGVTSPMLNAEALKTHNELPESELQGVAEVDKKTVDSVPEDLSRDPLPKEQVEATSDRALSPRTVPPPQLELATKPSVDAPVAVDKRMLTVPQSPVQARQSFATATAAMTQPASRRPSAMPQAGVLIGAGFARSGRKGTGPKKAPVREVVLPPIKVLIVEDNPINQRILTQFMKRKKIQYAIAKDGREAVNQWQTGGFHLILMDIQLPVMDGIEATKEIRKLEHFSNIGILPSTPPASAAPPSKRELDSAGDGTSSSSTTTTSAASPMPTPFRPSVIIVALTASVFHSDRVAALAAGCNDFLTKPVNLTWLEKKIIEWGSMQYILLSGFSDHWSGATTSEAGPGSARLAVGTAGRAPHAGQGALAAAANSREIAHAFGTAPDVRARALADRLQILPSKRSRAAGTGGGAVTPSTGSSTPPTPAKPLPDTENKPQAQALAQT